MIVSRLKSWYRKYPLWTIALLLFVLLVVVHDYEKSPTQKRFAPCLDYVEKGKLYEGDLFCFAPPLVFYIPYLFEITFGGNFDVALHLLMILAHVVGFVILYTIVQKETKQPPPLLLFGLLYFSCIYVISLFGGTEYVLDADLSYLFLLLGVYILYYTHLRYKGIIAPLCMLVALLNKFTTLVGVVFFLGWYFCYISPKKKWFFCCEFKKFKEIIPGITLSIIILILLKLRFPHLFIYSLFMHASFYQPYLQPLTTVIKELFTFSPYINLLYTFYAIQAVLIFVIIAKREWKPYLLYAVVGWWFVVISRLFYHSGWNNLFSVYSMPIMPFLIISFFYLKTKYYDPLRKPLVTLIGRIFLSSIIIFFVLNFLFPFSDSLLFSDLEAERTKLQDDILSGIHFLQVPLDKKIVVESPYANYTPQKLARAHPQFAQSKFIELTPENKGGVFMEDPNVIALIKLLEDAKDTAIPPSELDALSPFMREVMEQIKRGEVGMIVLSPPQWSAIRKIIDDPLINFIMFRQYCKVAYPDFDLVAHTGLDRSIFYSADKSACGLNETVARYYQEMIPRICNQSKTAADTINRFLKGHNFTQVPCDQQSKDFVDRYAHRNKLTYEAGIFLAIIVINGIYFLVERRKQK